MSLLAVTPATAQQPPTEPPAAPAPADFVERWPDTVSTLTAGTPNSGELDAEGGQLGGGAPFDIHEFVAAPGSRIGVRLDSEGFAPAVMVVGPDGTSVATNAGVNPSRGHFAEALFFPAASGTYQAWVSSNSGNGGPYTVRLETMDVAGKGGALAADQSVAAWLAPGDDTDHAGRYLDRWSLRLPDYPLAILADSDQLDVFVKVLDAKVLAASQDNPDGPAVTDTRAGALQWANDLERLSGDRRALLYLAPTPEVPAGSEVLLDISALGRGSAGSYRLTVARFPAAADSQGSSPTAQVRLRLLQVRGADGKGGSTATTEQLQQNFEQARQIWRQCGIELVLDAQQPHPPLHVPGLEAPLRVNSQDWSPEELALLAHEMRTGPAEGTISVFLVSATDGSQEGHSLAYPSTNYSPHRNGIVISDAAVQQPELRMVLAHEIGHMLGLLHSIDGDGDPLNDTLDNLMATNDDSTIGTVGQLTPWQCAVARRAPHFVHGTGEPVLFTRSDKVLPSDRAISGSLLSTDGQVAPGQRLDVYYFEGKAGERVRVDAFSDQLDTYLMIETADGQGLLEDDDGGDGWNARAELTLPVDGDYVVGLTTAAPVEAGGAYQLRLTRLAAPSRDESPAADPAEPPAEPEGTRP